MIPTLIKLLAMRIVASNLLGCSFKDSIRLLFFESANFRSLISLDFSEKKATSEPEIKALQNNKNNIAAIPIPMFISVATTKTSASILEGGSGSGSKEW